MNWDKVANLVKKSAPLLGAAVGGPPGAAIGGAVSLLLGAFGLGEDASADQLAAAIQTDPQAAIKLRELEMGHALELGKLVLEHERIRLADIASARARQVESEKATGTRDVNLYVLAWTVVSLFFALVAVLIFRVVPDANLGPVNQLFGAMAAGFGMVLQYFFGSSKSSADKTNLLAGKDKQ
jgi:hypothetical protein